MYIFILMKFRKICTLNKSLGTNHENRTRFDFLYPRVFRAGVAPQGVGCVVFIFDVYF